MEGVLVIQGQGVVRSVEGLIELEEELVLLIARRLGGLQP
jgi:hypothetical protein